MDNKQLAARIRAFRKLKGLTQTDLAEKLGISVAIIGAIERGVRKADTALIQSISAVLHISEEELLGTNR